MVLILFCEESGLFRLAFTHINQHNRYVCDNKNLGHISYTRKYRYENFPKIFRHFRYNLNLEPWVAEGWKSS
jgi:hypothetical protein